MLVLDEPTEGIQPSIIKDIGRAITYLRDEKEWQFYWLSNILIFAEIWQTWCISWTVEKSPIPARRKTWTETMYAAISPSDPPSIARAQRAVGHGRVSFKAAADGATKLDRLYQQGCAKIRLPRVYGSRAAEAVLINSSGGLTGGDDLGWNVTCGPGTHGVATTQACEKVYKSVSGTAKVATTIRVADGARLDWLPQETILFNRASLERTLDVELEGSARFMAVETVLLGRIAMGENVHALTFDDTWRIRRDGRLIHADALKLDGNVTKFGAAAAILSGHLAFASLCYSGPEDSEQLGALAQTAHDLINSHEDCTGGVSAFSGKLLIRLTAPQGMQLRAALIPLISLLRAGEPLPRVWTT